MMHPMCRGQRAWKSWHMNHHQPYVENLIRPRMPWPPVQRPPNVTVGAQNFVPQQFHPERSVTKSWNPDFVSTPTSPGIPTCENMIQPKGQVTEDFLWDAIFTEQVKEQPQEPWEEVGTPPRPPPPPTPLPWERNAANQPIQKSVPKPIATPTLASMRPKRVKKVPIRMKDYTKM